MKVLALLFLSLIATQALWSQNTLADTVKINAVLVESEASHSQMHQLDSLELTHPQHLDLGDLLSKKSHLFVKSYGIGSLATASLRGTGSSHTQLYWNGISINSSTNGSADLSLFPLFFMDEVELNHGLNSSVDGTGGLGGAIGLNTQPIFKPMKQLAFSGKLGSFGQRQYTGKLRWGTNQVHAVTKVYHNRAENDFTYQDLTQEGFPMQEVVNASLEQIGLLQSISFRPKESHLFDAHFWWFDSKRNLPPLMTQRENKELQEDKSIRAILSYQRYGAKGKWTAKSAFLHDVLIYQNERASINSQSETNSWRSRVDFTTSIQSFQLRAQAKYDLNQALSPSFSNLLQEQRLSFLAQLSTKIKEKWELSFTAREFIVLEQDQYFVPQLKINYQVGSLIDFYTLIGSNVKYPNLNDLYFEPAGNRSLKAETSNNAEVGIQVESDWLKGKLEQHSQLAIFYATIENYIQWSPTAFGYWQPSNLNEVETKGLELNSEWSYQLKKMRHHLQFAYSYTQSVDHSKDHEFDESNGKQLIYIPIHKGNVSFRTSVKSYSIAVNHQLIGKRFLSSDNEEELPSYQLLDISLEKLFSKKINQFSLTFGVKNVFDLEYQAIEWRPMPNRNYFIKMNYQFTK